MEEHGFEEDESYAYLGWEFIQTASSTSSMNLQKAHDDELSH